MSKEAGYTKDWLHDGAVLRLVVHKSDEQTLSALAADMQYEYQRWPADIFLRVILDMRAEGLEKFGYGLRHTRVLGTLRPDLKGRIAAIVSSKIAAQMLESTLRGIPGHRESQVFTTEEAALAWLLEENGE